MEILYVIGIVLITIVASSRLTRLLTHDAFPPVAAVRHWYGEKTDGSAWQLLAYCGYCMSFWVTLVVGGWAYFAGLYHPSTIHGSVGVGGTIWLIFMAPLAASYLAAILMAYDGDNEESD